MKMLLFYLLLLCLGQSARGQITGQLTTAAGQPVPFANVLLLRRADSTLVRAVLTNEAGRFQLEHVGPGAYRVRASSLGYQTWTSPAFDLSAAQPSQDFGPQVLRTDARQLGEVVVRAEKPLVEQTVEGTVVNVASSVLTKGSSVLQLLERAPGVVIDYRNGSMALHGKSGVMVMLNGKLVRLPVEQVVALLGGMSANEIEKIELLTTPGARYDAEGSAGLINIVQKKNAALGTNGSFALTGGYGWREKASGSLSLAHQTPKLGLYGSYAFSRDHRASDLHINSAQNMPVLGGPMNVVVYDTTQTIQTNYDATLGLDLHLNLKTTLGGSVAWNRNIRSATNFNHTSYTILPDSLLLFQGVIRGKNRWQNLSSSLYAETRIGEGEQASAALDYLHYANQNPSEVRSAFVTEGGAPAGNNDSLYAARQRGFANTSIRVGLAKLDYSRQVSPAWKWEAGAKGTYTRSISSSGIESLVADAWVSRSETATRMVMEEGIRAVYAAAHVQLRSATSLVIGARYEHSRTRMADAWTEQSVADRKLGVLFPNLSFSRKLTEHSELQVSYSKRISRPSYNDLASYIRYSDATAVYTGNPLLKPTITNNLRLGYTYRGYPLALLFSRDDHPIARYQLTQSPAGNLLYVSPQNVAWQNSVTLQATLPWTVREWWQMSYGFSGGLRQFRLEYTPRPARQTYFGYSLNASQSFKLPRAFSAEVSGWYNAAAYNGTIKVGRMGSLNVGLKKELKNNQGSLQLAVTDLLRTMRIHSYFGAVTEEVFAIKNHVIFNTESRRRPIVRLTYSRVFGTQSSAPPRPGNSSEDEKGRVRKE